MDAPKFENDLDTVHFPPLTKGERVKCSYLDEKKLLVVGSIYTIKDNSNNADGQKIDQIVLFEIADKTFPETLFDRIKN